MKIIIPEIEDIVNFYKPEVIEDIAKETGFVQRESKFGGVEFLGLMTQGLYSNPNASLNQMAGMVKDINPDVQISGSGIHQRIVGAGVEFLKEILSCAMQLVANHSIGEEISSILSKFTKVHLLDSTQVSLPPELSER